MAIRDKHRINDLERERSRLSHGICHIFHRDEISSINRRINDIHREENDNRWRKFHDDMDRTFSRGRYASRRFR